MTRTGPTGTHYSDYLQLGKLLDAQNPRSGKGADAAHDEMLFIVIHQAYELWFKQILHEVGSVLPLFQEKSLDEASMGFIVARLERVVEIQRILVDQLTILETMTPLDFLDFRDYLVPASGFQSVQFRLIEISLGLRQQDRTPLSADAYRTRLTDAERKQLEAVEERPSLVELVEEWLERIPFLDTKGYNFWSEYHGAVRQMLQDDADIVRNNSMLSEDERKDQLGQLADAEKGFQILINRDEHNKLREEGQRRLSHRATSAALFIELYRDFPALQLPHKLLRLLVDIDELFTAWRQRHVIMVHRMIGSKIGTGGSAGHKYLRSAAQKHRVFTDLFDLPTFLVKRSALPKLPDELAKQLRFNYEGAL